ncbi:MAG: CotH kinase family protein [Bacteroidetes bacterium]|nr:CotH kinase family protein [Bacteroidota bacterium]
MKKIFIFLLASVYINSQSQTFTGAGGSVLNNGGQETPFNIAVSGLSPTLIDSVFGIEEVFINLIHPAVEEVQIYLKSPSGIIVDLSGVLSCSGTNFANTTFNNSAPLSITTGSAPYNGIYSPVGNLGRFNTQKAGNGNWTLYIKDFISGPNTGSLTSWSIKFSNAPAKPVVLNSSNLPLVFLTTSNNQDLTSTSILSDFGIINNNGGRNYITDPKNDFSGKAMCHLRGSSSKRYEKKNIKVELTDASGAVETPASLLGMPIESDWVLTPGYSDKTLMRNALTQYLYTSMGHYSPRYRLVELFINGEYFGVYTLMEQIKRDKNRVDIAKLTAADNSFPYITGGYIIQIDRTDNPGWYSLNPGLSATNAKFYYQYNYPNESEITVQQKNYIKSVTDSFETVMQSSNFADPVTGYKKFIEDNSFIDFFIINEISKNPDAYRLSTYLYKDNIMDGGKMHIGPVWDYDISWHNSNYGNSFNESAWQFDIPNDDSPIPTWWTKLMTDANFKNKLYCRYHTLRLGILSNAQINQFIDQTATLLSESQSRNFKQFPIMGAYIFPNPQIQSGATYSGEVDDLKQWVAKRGAWLDANIPGFCSNVGVNEITKGQNNVEVFPNPFSNSCTIMLNRESPSEVSIEVIDITGQTVISVKSEEKIKGIFTQEISTEKLSAGVYFVKVNTNNNSAYKKIIKL